MNRVRDKVYNPNCDADHCRDPKGQVRVLPIGGSSNAILCLQCYQFEMAFRRDRIREGVPFDLPAWETLKVYEGS